VARRTEHIGIWGNELADEAAKSALTVHCALNRPSFAQHHESLLCRYCAMIGAMNNSYSNAFISCRLSHFWSVSLISSHTEMLLSAGPSDNRNISSSW